MSPRNSSQAAGESTVHFVDLACAACTFSERLGMPVEWVILGYIGHYIGYNIGIIMGIYWGKCLGVFVRAARAFGLLALAPLRV